jgi:hypothetical protein
MIILFRSCQANLKAGSLGDENTLSTGETLFEDMYNRQFFQSGLVTDKDQ